MLSDEAQVWYCLSKTNRQRTAIFASFVVFFYHVPGFPSFLLPFRETGKKRPVFGRLIFFYQLLAHAGNCAKKNGIQLKNRQDFKFRALANVCVSVEKTKKKDYR